MKKQQIKRPKSSAQTLPEIEAHLQRISDAAPLMIWMSGLDKGGIYFNQRWLAFTGKRLKDELGDGWSQGVHPDDLKRCLKIYTEAFDRQDEFSMEYRLRHHAGAYRWILENGVPNYDGEGKFTGFVASCIDIHDRVTLEEFLRESVFELTALINSTDDLICARDREGALLLWNEAFRASIKAAFGVEPHVGMRTDLEQRENSNRHYSLFTRALSGERLRDEFNYTLPSGEVSSYEIVWSPIQKDTEIVGVAEVTSNITDRKSKEVALAESNERFKAFIQNSSEAIYCVGLKRPLNINLSEEEQIAHFYKYGYIEEANDTWAKIAGYEDPKNLIGARLEEFMPPTIPENMAFLKEVIRAEYKLNDYETVEKYRSGVKIRASNNVRGTIDNGQLVRIWGTGRDVTKQRKMEEELLRNQIDLQKLAGRLISSQEHEFRRLARELHDGLTQQLAVLAIDAGNLEERFHDLSEPVRKKVASIRERLIEASKDVHTLARNLHPSILDDLGLVRAVESECRHFSSRAGVAVIFNPKNIPQVIPENTSLSLYRIIQEGLSNIAKHAETKNAYIFLEGTDDSLVLTIRDTGRGFDPGKVRHKTGLGFGSMRERARLVNGTFSITSSPGKGSIIEVTVPLQETFNEKTDGAPRRRPQNRG